MSTVQHTEATKLLSLIASANAEDRLLTYATAAAALGRDPGKNARMVAQICDLLDAAAAYADVPLLALVKVREKSGKINRKAWTTFGVSTDYREAIISRSLEHNFTREDISAIKEALMQLEGTSNVTAWRFLREMTPPEQIARRLAGLGPPAHFDAILDVGSDAPERQDITASGYARDPRVRDAVRRRARGRCEYCGELGFLCPDGTRYLECHHVIALADDGADRVTNVIALCPQDHREAHFGARRDEIEAEMMERLRSLS